MCVPVAFSKYEIKMNFESFDTTFVLVSVESKKIRVDFTKEDSRGNELRIVYRYKGTEIQKRRKT